VLECGDFFYLVTARHSLSSTRTSVPIIRSTTAFVFALLGKLLCWQPVIGIWTCALRNMLIMYGKIRSTGAPFHCRRGYDRPRQICIHLTVSSHNKVINRSLLRLEGGRSVGWRPYLLPAGDWRAIPPYVREFSLYFDDDTARSPATCPKAAGVSSPGPP
jgi:hypothetical protein